MTSPDYRHFLGLYGEFLVQRIGQNKHSKGFRDKKDTKLKITSEKYH